MKGILQAVAAKVEDGSPCCDWVGENGAGHFVKMVHNGIEYGDMQLICEAYLLMNAAGMTPAEMSDVFARWNEGELDSYLIEITRDILGKTDDQTGRPMVDVILDTAGQKGTGKWASITALDLGQPLTLIGEAVFARCLSAMKEARVAASAKLRGPRAKFKGDREKFVDDIRQALYASKIVSYAQGYQLMKAAAEEYGWNLNYGGIALMWRGGDIRDPPVRQVAGVVVVHVAPPVRRHLAKAFAASPESRPCRDRRVGADLEDMPGLAPARHRSELHQGKRRLA